MNEALKSYCERKTGRNQALSWIIKSYLPSLLIVFIMVVLVFALIFVSSMSKAIEDTLVYLGSGNVTAYSSLENIELKGDEKVFEVSSASAMIASYSLTKTTPKNSFLILGLSFLIILAFVLQWMKPRFGLKPEEYKEKDIKFKETAK